MVGVALDLRALPTGTSADGIDLFVRGEAWDLANSGSPGAEARVWTTPGTGIAQVAFDAETEQAALARCARAVEQYLPTAPALAGSTEAAAQVTERCHACPPEARAPRAAL